ncbi:MAG: hypothetical protein BGN88_10740 [Clostridiales bacterium 43-6]|nr:MAG: hypothetical protein BGN88_10740 [Clostridiales bacterium 43-6]
MIESLKKNKTGILLMLISSACVCTGQLFWKLSANGNLLFLLTGFCFYGLGALIMIVAYKFGSLSVLQPMLSVNYVISILIAPFFLSEPVTLFKIAGVLIIMTGVVLIAGGDE